MASRKTIPTAGTGDVGTTNTTPANTLLAASAAVNRWVRGITVTNKTSATVLNWSFGIGTAAILATTNSIWFQQTIQPGATFSYTFPGGGRRLMNPATDVLMGFASGAGVSMDIDYDEELP